MGLDGHAVGYGVHDSHAAVPVARLGESFGKDLEGFASVGGSQFGTLGPLGHVGLVGNGFLL